jgi:hypothetical protein
MFPSSRVQACGFKKAGEGGRLVSALRPDLPFLKGSSHRIPAYPNPGSPDNIDGMRREPMYSGRYTAYQGRGRV